MKYAIFAFHTWHLTHEVTSHFTHSAQHTNWGRDTPERLYKAPTDYTKPQNIIQNIRNMQNAKNMKTQTY